MWAFLLDQLSRFFNEITRKATKLSSLPPEIIQQIASLLPPEFIITFGLTCKRFYSLMISVPPSPSMGPVLGDGIFKKQRESQVQTTLFIVSGPVLAQASELCLQKV